MTSGREPFPLGPTWDGNGTNFSLFSEHAQRVELCLFDEDDARSASRSPTAPRSTGTATCPASAPARATATASTAPTSPRRATASTRPSCCIDPYAKAIEGNVDWEAANALPYVPDAEDPENADLEPDDEDSAPAIPKCLVVDDRLRLGGRRAAAHPVERDGHLRGPREGLHEAPSRCARGPARHLRRPGLRAGDRLPQGARRHRGRAAADPPHRRRELPARAGPDQLLGLQLDRLPRAARAATPRPARPASRCASSRAWSRPCTGRGSR